jgi:hypothetical protein
MAAIVMGPQRDSRKLPENEQSINLSPDTNDWNKRIDNPRERRGKKCSAGMPEQKVDQSGL